MLTPSNQYLQAVEEINDYVNQAKCRASVSVNSEIMKTNIFIGNVIIRNSEWGNKFVENLSKDMISKCQRLFCQKFKIYEEICTDFYGR